MAGVFEDLIPQAKPDAFKGAFDDLVPTPQPQAFKGAFDDLVPTPDTSFQGALLQGLGDPLRGIGGGLEMLGADGVGNSLQNIPKVPNYESASERFMNPREDDFTVGGFAPGYLPRSAVEQGGQVLGSIASRVFGGVAGGVLGTGAGFVVGGPPGAASGALIGAGLGATALPFAFEGLQIVKPVAYERAKNNGRTEPNSEDMTYAWTTAAAAGALNSLGAKYLPGGEKAVGSATQKVIRAFYGEGVTEGLQALTQDVGGSLNTEAGVSVNPREALGEAIIGGVAGGGTQAGVVGSVAGRNAIEQRIAPERAIGRVMNEAVDARNFDPQHSQEIALEALSPERRRILADPNKAYQLTQQPQLVISSGEEGTAKKDDEVAAQLQAEYEAGQNAQPSVAPIKNEQPIPTPQPAINNEPAETPAAEPVAAKTTNDYTVDTEDNGIFSIKVMRLPDGGAVLFSVDGGPPVEYNGDFAKDKTDEELLRYTYEPVGYRGAKAAQAQNNEPRPANRRTLSTATGTKIDADFEVVPLSSLQQAEGDLQNRDRTRATSDDQIREIVAGFDPERLGESAEVDRGAPIVGDDNIIESGNGRVRAISQVYQNDPAKAEAYRKMMRSLGFDPDGVDQPVLIRRRKTQFTPEQRRQFVIDANTESTMRLTASEQAKSDADILNDAVLDNYRGGDVTTAGNANFVRAFIGQLPAASRSELIDSNGQLSQNGIRRIENAMMARAYGNQDLLNKLLESRENNIRSVGGALLDVAGPFAKLRQSVAEGRVKPEFDISKQIAEAARTLSSIRDNGGKVREYLDQIGMFEAIDPVVERLVKSFYNSNLTKPLGREKIAETLNDYIKQAEQQTTETALFDMKPVTPEQILDKALERKAANENVPTTGNMFDGQQQPTGDTDASLATTDQETDESAGRARGSATDENTVDEVRRKKKPKSNGKQGPFNDAGRDIATSPYEQAWDAARAEGLLKEGVEPSLLPAPKQIAILSKVFTNVFGFKGVTVENNLQGREAIDAMLDGYAGIQSQMAVLGLPPSAISLGGTLKLRFLKQAGDALAYYSPADREIGMVRRNDSFAHEWGHALDWHVFFELGLTTDGEVTGRGLSGKIKQGGQSSSPPIQQAFKKLVDTMFGKEVDAAGKILELEKKIEVQHKQIEKLRTGQATDAKLKQIQAKQKFIERLANQIAEIRKLPKASYKANTDYYLEARMLDKQGATEAADGGYWQRPTEMLARGFEAFIANKLADQNFAEEFMVNPNAQYQGQGLATEKQAEFFNKAYPQMEERDAIFAAFDDLIAAVRDAEILGPLGKRPVDAQPVEQADLTGVNRLKNWKAHTDRQQLSIMQQYRRDLEHNRKVNQDMADRRKKVNKLRGRRTAFNVPGGKMLGALNDAIVNVTTAWFGTIRGFGLSVLARNGNNAPSVQNLVDMFWTDPGSGKLSLAKVEEVVQAELTAKLNDLGRVMTDIDWRGLSPIQQMEVRDILVDETGKLQDSASRKVLTAARAIRRMLDDHYTWLQAQGMNIGYTKNGYLPRNYDAAMVALDSAEFVKDATQVYMQVFNKEFGTRAQVLNDFEKTRVFSDVAMEVLPKEHPMFKAAMDLRSTLREIDRQTKALENGAPNTDVAAIEQSLEKLQDEVQELVEGLYDEVQSVFAVEGAESWRAGLLGLNDHSAYFDAEPRGPNGAYTKSRVLPEVTDRIMKKWMVTDLEYILSGYITSTTQRAAQGKLVGHKDEKPGKQFGWKLDELFDEMRQQGVDAEDIGILQKQTDTILSRNTADMTVTLKTAEKVLSFIVSTLGPWTLGFSYFSQISDPFNASIRDRNPMVGFKMIGNQLKQLAVALTPRVTPMSWREQVAWNKATAEYWGVTSHYMYDQMIFNRFHMLPSSMADARYQTEFYHKFGIHAHHMSMRRAALAVGVARVQKLANRLDKDRMAVIGLRELGLDIENDTGLRDFLKTLDTTDITKIEASPYAQKIRMALVRFVDERIANPKVSDRPLKATQLGTRHMYAITTYLTWQGRHAGIASLKGVRTVKQEKGYTAAGIATAALAGTFGVAVVMQLGAQFLRAMASGRWEERVEEWEEEPEKAWSRAVSYTGVWGLGDIGANAYLGIKYRKALSESATGPHLGKVTNTLEKTIALNVNNNDNNNSAERAAFKAWWDTVIMPGLMRAFITKVPVANFPGVAPAVVMTAKRNDVQNAVVDAVVGPDETKKGNGSSSSKGFSRTDKF